MRTQEGQWVFHVDGDLDTVERYWTELTAAGMSSAAEVDGAATVHFAHGRPRPDHDAAGPPRLEPGVPGRWERLPERDWHAEWRAALTPVRAGRWIVTPSWLATGSAHELVIDPGQAFGTGHHETTLACLRALDDLVLADRSVLDVGTGTGVLAIAVARRGAAVTAIDIDPLAVSAAAANADRNGARIALGHGGVDTVAGRHFDVVVANLDSATLLAHAERLSGLVATDGRLVAGGVGNARGGEVAAAFEQVGLAVDAEPGVEWTLLRARRSDT